METAYVLVKSKIVHEMEVLTGILKLIGVKEVFQTFGAHDIMAKLESDNLEKIRETISQNVQKIDKIRSIVTLMKK